MKNIILLLVALIAVSCSKLPQGEADYPKTKQQLEEERVGKLTGEDGIVLYGGSRKSSATEGINVNSYLWRAALDTAHIMPMLSTDPFGGVILTDWYRVEGTSHERYKLNIFIIGAELRSDAIKVAAFKQTKKANGEWGDAVNSIELANKIEDKILLKAREIKYKSPR
jgi:hypothetical protein